MRIEVFVVAASAGIFVSPSRVFTLLLELFSLFNGLGLEISLSFDFFLLLNSLHFLDPFDFSFSHFLWPQAMSVRGSGVLHQVLRGRVPMILHLAIESVSVPWSHSISTG